MAGTTKRYAVVSGGNKGIGFSISKQLASQGIAVVLTARDEKKGLEAVDTLAKLGLSDHVFFHQLDITDSTSIASLAHFLKTHFGKLDILVTIICMYLFTLFVRCPNDILNLHDTSYKSCDRDFNTMVAPVFSILTF